MPSVVNRWSGDPAPPGLARALALRDAGPWRDAPVLFLLETGSTNDVALRAAADGAPDGTCVLALKQTAGRGRRGRTWQSPAGAGLYFSPIVRPPATALHAQEAGAPGDLPGPAALLTLMAAVACVEAITAATGLAPTIKWPNDLIVDRGVDPATGRWERRKLAGILAEGAVSGDAVQQIVLGIGINLTAAAYPPDVAAIATSLEAETGRPPDFFVLFAACRAALARETASLFAGDVAGLLRRWRAHAPSAEGVRVAWEQHGVRRTGTTAGLDPTGALAVVADDGRRELLVAGEVTWA
jgi:BirA family biotin operon repressor/biotin-[acetyl-CoA-carboxylase] ligase